MRHEIIILILIILVPSSSLQCTVPMIDCMIEMTQKMKMGVKRQSRETAKHDKKIIKNLDKFIGFYQVPLL